MAASAQQLQQLAERGRAATVAATAETAYAMQARTLRQRLNLLSLSPKLKWFERDDDWDAIQRREHICIWPGLYRMRVWRLGPPGGAWGWELQTLGSSTPLRGDIVRRKRDAQGEAVKAAAAVIKTERDLLEQVERETTA
jgi:hypothetical protein